MYGRVPAMIARSMILPITPGVELKPRTPMSIITTATMGGTNFQLNSMSIFPNLKSISTTAPRRQCPQQHDESHGDERQPEEYYKELQGDYEEPALPAGEYRKEGCHYDEEY